MKYIKTFKEIKESEHFTNTANDSIVEESFLDFRLILLETNYTQHLKT